MKRADETTKWAIMWVSLGLILSFTVCFMAWIYGRGDEVKINSCDGNPQCVELILEHIDNDGTEVPQD